MMNLPNVIIIKIALFCGLYDIQELSAVHTRLNKILEHPSTIKMRLNTWLLYLKRVSRFDEKHLIQYLHPLELNSRKFRYGIDFGEFPKWILSSGDIDSRGPPLDLGIVLQNDANYFPGLWERQTFLCMMTSYGYTSLMLLLLKSGANPNSAEMLPLRRNLFMQTPLSKAIYRNCSGCIKLLLHYKANPNIASVGGQGSGGIASLISVLKFNKNYLMIDLIKSVSAKFVTEFNLVNT